MQGVRAPTDPSHWHAATRVLPRPASSGSVDPRGTCIERGSRRVPARRQPLLSRRGATTSSPHSPPRAFDPTFAKARGKAPGGTDGNRSVKLQLRHRASPPHAFFERAAGMSRPTKMVHLRHNQRWCTFGTTMMVHLRHNHDGAPSAQPSCCTSRVNRESARTGNIARPFVVTVDDVSPTQPPRRPGDCGPSRC